MEGPFFKDRKEFPKSLIVAAMVFNSVVMAANFVGHKPLDIFGLIVSAGSAIFPLTYLISALTTEIYGRENAGAIIKIGLCCSIFTAIFISQTIHFPYPSFWDKQAHYEIIMQQTWRIFVLSSVAYLVSEYTNLYVFSYVTKKLKQEFFRLRIFASTLCAVVVDTLFLIPIMIYSSPTYAVLARKIFSLIIFKSFFVFVGLLFISMIRDYLLNGESKRNLVLDVTEVENKDIIANNNSTSNVYWYRFNKRIDKS